MRLRIIYRNQRAWCGARGGGKLNVATTIGGKNNRGVRWRILDSLGRRLKWGLRWEKKLASYLSYKGISPSHSAIHPLINCSSLNTSSFIAHHLLTFIKCSFIYCKVNKYCYICAIFLTIFVGCYNFLNNSAKCYLYETIQKNATFSIQSIISVLYVSVSTFFSFWLRHGV